MFPDLRPGSESELPWDHRNARLLAVVACIARMPATIPGRLGLFTFVQVWNRVSGLSIDPAGSREGTMASTKKSQKKNAIPAAKSGPKNDGVTSARRASFTVATLDASDAGRAIVAVEERLLSLLDLALTLKHVHWNVVGPQFIAVHQMLDPQVVAVNAMVDAVAERISTLGGSPNGLPGHLVAHRTWDDYALARAGCQSHLAALDVVYEGVISGHRNAIAKIDATDPVTHDLLVQQSGALEHFQWFVRAHLEDPAGGLSHAGTSDELGAARKVANRRRTRSTPV